MKKNVNCKTKNIFANPLIEVWLTYKRLNVLDICDLFGFEIRVCLETITTLCQEPIHHLQEFLPALAQVVENLPTEQKTWVRSLSWEGPLEKGMATHSSMLAWRIPWTEEPGGLQSMESQRVRHDWSPQHSTEGLEADVLVSAVVSEQMLLGLPLCCFVAAALGHHVCLSLVQAAWPARPCPLPSLLDLLAVQMWSSFLEVVINALALQL